MKRMMIVSLLLLAACQRGPETVEETNVEDTLAELDQAEAALDEAQKEAADFASGEASKALAAIDEVETEGEPEPEPDAPSLCWQDYCPCEPGQDGQGAEASLCRTLKAGIPVDDEIMAAAAMMRDARQQMRDFERDNGAF